MIVVTGGAGFIGSNLVAALEERGGDEIVVCDALGSEDKWRNLAKREITELIAPDELSSWLSSNIASVHMIFHLGAISSTSTEGLVSNGRWIRPRRSGIGASNLRCRLC